MCQEPLRGGTILNFYLIKAITGFPERVYFLLQDFFLQLPVDNRSSAFDIDIILNQEDLSMFRLKCYNMVKNNTF